MAVKTGSLPFKKKKCVIFIYSFVNHQIFSRAPVRVHEYRFHLFVESSLRKELPICEPENISALLEVENRTGRWVREG